MRSYDPAFACELAVIVRDGIDCMYGRQEEVFYYITIHNQNYPMPAMPPGDHVADGIVRGMYCFQRSARAADEGRKAHLFGSGAIMTEVLEAARLLEACGVAADVWSVTSYNELSRKALRAARDRRLSGATRKPYVQRLLEGEEGVFVAASDYMKALPLSIAQWVPGPYTVLGTDGFGLSESREDLRRHFEVNSAHIAYAAVALLAQQGRIGEREARDLASRWGIEPGKPDASMQGPTGYRRT
jgi:pyruvate dehydrogenase E1 component